MATNIKKGDSHSHTIKQRRGTHHYLGKNLGKREEAVESKRIKRHIYGCMM
jgi:hypothetical protein